MIQFYAPEIAVNPVLPEAESQHAIRVLRHGVGDRLRVVDGRGRVYECEIVDARPRGALVEIVSEQERPRVWPVDITVAVAPTKNADRMEWLVEKLVEVGIDRFVPVGCRHSERRTLKPERIERVAVAAMKQSLKAVLPRIDALTPLADFLREPHGEEQCLMGYCDATVERLAMARTYRAGAGVRLLIGPEGDFSPEEVAEARAAGYVPVTFGDNRLRTETAALYGATAVHVINSLG